MVQDAFGPGSDSPLTRTLPKVAIIPNLDKPDSRQVMQELAAWLASRNVPVGLLPDHAGLAGHPEMARALDDLIAWSDFAVVLGGDGTLLNWAKVLAPAAKPILGVNLGHLGFLTEIEVPELFEAMPKILEGRYTVESRMMLEAKVEPATAVPGQSGPSFLALNEIVVSKGPFARVVNIETSVGGRLVTTYPADGVIVATPTGSTAYSLSAGGPIISPEVDVIIITPVCPHTFFARAVVVSAEETVVLRVVPEHVDTMLTMDGQRGHALSPGDRIIVKKASLSARLIRRRGWNFYEVLKRKLQESGGAS